MRSLGDSSNTKLRTIRDVVITYLRIWEVIEIDDTN